MKTLLYLTLIVCLLAAIGAVANPVSAQDIQTKGSIGGTVTDVDGAALPGATITVTGALGERTTTADSNGVFAVDNLIPGRYTVTAGNSGFKTAVAANIDVFVGKQSTLTLKLEPGEVTATVNVTDTGNISTYLQQVKRGRRISNSTPSSAPAAITARKPAQSF